MLELNNPGHLLIILIFFVFVISAVLAFLSESNQRKSANSGTIPEFHTPEEYDQRGAMVRAKARLIEAETELLMKQTENADVAKFIGEMRRKQNG
jgi:hypothetical protein